MFCTKCGRPTEGDEILCAECAAAQAQKTPTEASVEPAVETPVEAPAIEPVLTEEAVPVAEAPAFTVAPTEPVQKKKKKKLGLALGIIGGTVVVLGVLCLCFWSWVSSFFNRTILPADTYLQKVETNAIKENAETLTDNLYDATDELLNAEFKLPPAGDLDGRIIIGDELLSMVQPYLPEELGDLKWLSNIMVDMDYAINEDNIQCSAGFGLGNERLLTMNALFDTKAGVVYLTVPELNAKPIEIKLDEDVMESFVEMEGSAAQVQLSKQMLEAIIRSLPEEKDLRKLIVDYTTLAVKELDDAKKSQTQIFVGTQSSNVTALTATIQQDDVYDAAEAILTKAQTDPVIIQFLNNLSANMAAVYPDGDFSNLQSSYMAGVAELLGTVQSGRGTIDYSQSVLFTTYVDHQDRIVGRKLENFVGGIATELFHYYKIHTNKDDYTYELFVPSTYGSEAIRLTGNYTNVNDTDNYSCNILVSERSYAVLELKNLTDTSATLRIQPSKALVDMLVDQADMNLPTTLLSGLAVELRVDGTRYELDILSNSSSLLMFRLDAKEGSNKITVPSGGVNANDEYQMYKWVSEIDFIGFLEKLEKAGVPASIIDAARDAVKDAMGASF